MTETLLCLAARHVDALDLAEGFSRIEPTAMAQLFQGDQLWLGPRSWLETDEGYRQLVSYVVCRHDASVLVYRRTPKGGEARLHGRLSIGIGGHVNIADVVSPDGSIDVPQTLRRACERELKEEIDCGPPRQVATVGIIKETVNAVSRVHLGVVVECWLPSPEAKLLDPGLHDARFVAIDALDALAQEMETWSSSLLPYLKRRF